MESPRGVQRVPDTYAIIGADGTLETYSDIYKEETPERFERASELQQEIIEATYRIEASYLRIAKAVATFKQERLYLSLGFPTFKDWADSPELPNFGYRTAQRYVQIVEEVLPLLDERGMMEFLPMISVMSELLPVLNDENGKDKFIEAVQEIHGLSGSDARARIREIRGLPEKTYPTIFKAVVTRGEPYHTVRIYAQGDNPYECTNTGPIRVKPRDWGRWEERFGTFLEIV